MEYIFNSCSNLEYINMIDFNGNRLEEGKYSNIFNIVPENIVLCINKINIDKIYPQIESISCHIEEY